MDDMNMQTDMNMQIALELAKEAFNAGEVPVGCVIADSKTGEIVGKGRNRREKSQNALYHAELLAINEACKNVGFWRLCGYDIYVTLEPCLMCAGAIINSRLDRLFFGASEPRAGSVSVFDIFSKPLDQSPEVISGVLEEESSKLMREFFRKIRCR